MVIILKNISIWKDNGNFQKYSKLDKNLNVDVLIIGGGMTGISTLYHLSQSKLKIALVEQNRIGHSVTGNSTGKLNYLQNDLINKIRYNFNDNIAAKYIKAQRDSISLLINTINKENINCDLEKVSASIYTNISNEVNKLKNLEEFLNQIGISTFYENSNFVKSKYVFSVNDTYLINPLKFLYGLLKNKEYLIYENTSIIKIKKKENFYLCYTENVKIRAKKIIIASHYPYFNFPYLFPIKGYLEKSYLSASKYKENKISLISYSNPFISIRNYKNYLIYLSNTHSVNQDVNDAKNFNVLKKKLKDLKLKPDYLWSNIDIMTNDGLPYIGKINDNLFIGTGYNTWGLTNGFLAGKILSDLILNQKNEYVELFNPKRVNIKQFTGAVGDGIKSLSGYVNGYVNKYNSHTGNKICPHMKCNLVFNKIENTWDCPCHGSRFDKNGKCISAPANRDLK